MLARGDLDLSVCLSITFRVVYRNGLTYCHNYFLAIILVFPILNIFVKFRRRHPLQGLRMQVRYEKSELSRFVWENAQQ